MVFFFNCNAAATSRVLLLLLQCLNLFHTAITSQELKTEQTKERKRKKWSIDLCYLTWRNYYCISRLWAFAFCGRWFCFVIALRPQTPKRIRGGWSHYTDTSEPVDGGVGTLRLWTTRTILSVKMDRENRLTLLWPEWGSSLIPSDPQSELLTDAPQAQAKSLTKRLLFIILMNELWLRNWIYYS
jgi:hypothetical protein